MGNRPAPDDHKLIFQPPLLAGGGLQTATSDDGCWLLLKAVIK